MKHILFPITLLIAFACHGAADEGYEKLAQSAQPQTPPGWPVRVASCKVPCQIATGSNFFASYTYIVADPTLRSKLPNDFADRLAQEHDCGMNDFHSASFKAHKKALSTELIASGITSASLAMLITIGKSERNKVYISLDKHSYTYNVSGTTGPFRLGFFIDPEKRKLIHSIFTELNKQDRVKMLTELGRHDEVRELGEKSIPEELKDYDFILEIDRSQHTPTCSACSML